MEKSHEQDQVLHSRVGQQRREAVICGLSQSQAEGNGLQPQINTLTSLKHMADTRNVHQRHVPRT